MDCRYDTCAARLGSTTNPFIPNQLEEFGKKVNEGMKNIEVGALKQETFESIPIQHFDEIRRLSKLTGTRPSLHAPLVDPSGFQGGKFFSENHRKKNELFLQSLFDRAGKMTEGTKDSIPIVLHSAAPDSMAHEWEKGLKRSKQIKDNEGNIIGFKGAEKWPDDIGLRAMAVVNKDTGEISFVQHHEKYSLGGKEGEQEIWDVYRSLHNRNIKQWDDEKLKLFAQHNAILEKEERAAKKEEEALTKAAENQAIEKTGLLNDPQYQRAYERNKAIIGYNLQEVSTIKAQIEETDSDLISAIDSLYDKFQKHGKIDPERKQVIDSMKKDFTTINKKIEELRRKEIQLIKDQKMEDEVKQTELEKLRTQESALRIHQKNVLVERVAHLPSPEILVPIDEFAQEKTAETVSNVMVHAFNNFEKQGKISPTFAIENFFPETALSRAGELRPAIELARDETVKKLKCQGVGEKEARKFADQHIGVTWDVGHINAMRQAGLSEKELKELVLKETKEMIKGGAMLKHTHLTDNFGFFDSHLALGMGNVPLKEIIAEIKKEKFEGRFIEEGGGFINTFKKASFPVALEYLGTPIYGGSGGGGWPGFQSSPYEVMHLEYPQQHFNLYGSSFSTLPRTFGGAVGGEKSRFSETPNQ